MGEGFNFDLIIHRLDSMVKTQEITTEKFTNKLSAIEEKVTKLATTKETVEELKNWKHKMDEVVSPTQMKETIDEVGKLKTFRAQALMVWVVVQAIMFVLMFINDIIP